MIHGPCWCLESYVLYAVTATEKSGKKRSGGSKNRYIGRYLPADPAEEFGLEGGITPEQAGYAEYRQHRPALVTQTSRLYALQCVYGVEEE